MVAGAREVIHQIEYRQDGWPFLHAVASTMPPDSLREWDFLTRSIARPPAVDGPQHSLRYQVYPSGRAVLAWRYSDWKVARREEGARGQPPPVARVLVGPAHLLTPEVAIASCHRGLPDLAGPRPGQVTAGAELPAINAAELIAVAGARADELDDEASRQEGLRRVVAAALSDPDLPLAVGLDYVRIAKRPERLQVPLLWGLRRIVAPIFGEEGRGWSFSTFEPSLPEAVDPATLPGISFRPEGSVRAAGTAVRREIVSRPFRPGGPDDEGIYAQLAEWLVAEYQQRGDEELEDLLTDWAGSERRPRARLRKVHDGLRARRRPAVSHGIFMSYRRGDSGWAAGRLFDNLTGSFGSSQVFRDLASIAPGDDFVETIEKAIGSCDVLLALIGSQWLTVTGEDGRRRLDYPGDFVRLEIEAALERGITVIPILLDETVMPRADQLPASLAGLVRRQALKLSEDRFSGDFQRLRTTIEATLDKARQRARETAKDQARARKQARETAQEQARQQAPETLVLQDRDTVVRPATQAQVPSKPSAPPRPKLALSATRIDLGQLPVHGRSPEHRVRIRNAGGGDLNAQATTAASWLRLRRIADDLVVTMDTTAAGEYDGTIEVASDGGNATIKVRAQIDPAPAKLLEQSTFGPWLALVGLIAIIGVIVFSGLGAAAVRLVTGAIEGAHSGIDTASSGITGTATRGATGTATGVGSTLGGRSQLTATVIEPVSEGLTVPGSEVRVKVLKKGSLALVASGTLNASREFSTNVPTGQYQVCIHPPAGWTSTISTPNVLAGWICSETDVTNGPETATFYLSPPPQGTGNQSH